MARLIWRAGSQLGVLRSLAIGACSPAVLEPSAESASGERASQCLAKFCYQGGILNLPEDNAHGEPALPQRL